VLVVLARLACQNVGLLDREVIYDRVRRMGENLDVMMRRVDALRSNRGKSGLELVSAGINLYGKDMV
jgi:hypothetical protein